MTDPLIRSAAESKERERLRRVRRFCEDLYWGATEILGYDLLTEAFHKPICEWIVAHEDDDFLVLLAARDHYKTTIQAADLVRHIVRDPNKTHLVLHAVDEEACKLVEEVGTHFQKNKELRALVPQLCPSSSQRRWLKVNQFTVARDRYDRQPTLLGKSTGAEITGVHITGSIRPDDIIGRNTIEDSQLPKVKSWWQSTIMPVRRPGCKIRGTATRWDINDITGEWIKDKQWVSMVRAALETDGKPDYKGVPVLYSKREIEIRRRAMGPNFGPQMMNDPSPAGEKPWDQERCEHFISRDEAKGVGRIFVLSDPAPAKVGSFDGVGEKRRMDGTKDDWAIAAVKVRANGQRQEIILLNGRASKEWAPEAGDDAICELLRQYPGAMFFEEYYGFSNSERQVSMRRAARRNGVKLRWVEFKGSYRASGKNVRFAELANKAKNDEFLICDSCPKDFLEKFLGQARQWRPMGKKNSLRYDDCADVVAMATMDCVISRAPQAQFEPDEFSPYKRQQEEAEPIFQSRYIRA